MRSSYMLPVVSNTKTSEAAPSGIPVWALENLPRKHRRKTRTAWRVLESVSIAVTDVKSRRSSTMYKLWNLRERKSLADEWTCCSWSLPIGAAISQNLHCCRYLVSLLIVLNKMDKRADWKSQSDITEFKFIRWRQIPKIMRRYLEFYGRTPKLVLRGWKTEATEAHW